MLNSGLTAHCSSVSRLSLAFLGSPLENRDTGPQQDLLGFLTCQIMLFAHPMGTPESCTKCLPLAQQQGPGIAFLSKETNMNLTESNRAWHHMKWVNIRCGDAM